MKSGKTGIIIYIIIQTKDREMKKHRIPLRYKTAMLIISIVVFSAVLAGGTIYGWVASNLSAKGRIAANVTDGYSVRVELSENALTWSDYANVDFGDMYPGTKSAKKVYLKIVNESSAGYTISLMLKSPSSGGSEIPLAETADGIISGYYYLGSQIQLSRVTASGGAQNSVTGEGSYLVTTEAADSGYGQKNSVAERITGFDDIIIISGLYLGGKNSAGSEVIVMAEFTFTDNRTNQNMYQGFATKGGSCSRTLYFDIVDK